MNSGEYRAGLLIKNYLQSNKNTNVVSTYHTYVHICMYHISLHNISIFNFLFLQFGKNHTICTEKLTTIVTNFFSCRITSRQSQDIVQYIRAKPVFDYDNGFYACDINLLLPIDEIQIKVASHDLSFDVETKLANGITDIMSLKLVPQIYVTPVNIDIEQINNQILTIKGLDRVLAKIDVKSSDTSVVNITPTSKSINERLFKLKLLQEYPNDREISIIINSPLTQQDIIIPIQSPLSTAKCTKGPFYGTSFNDFIDFITKFGFVISVAIVLGVLIIVLMFIFNRPSPSDNTIFLSPKQQNGVRRLDQPSYVQTPVPQSPNNYAYMNDLNNSSPGSPRHDPIVYGDTSLVSPHRRLNRRFI